MVDDIDLNKLEIKVWTSYFRDGLWDIFYGLMLLTMGIRTLTDNVWFTTANLGAILIYTLGKICVTIPRLDYIKFGETRRVRLFLMIVLIGISVLITAIIGWIFSDNQGRFGGITATITFVGLYITVFGLMAFLMNHSRFILYGLLFIVILSGEPSCSSYSFDRIPPQ